MQQPRDWTREASYNSLSFFSCVVAWIKISFSKMNQSDTLYSCCSNMLITNIGVMWAASRCSETRFVDTNHHEPCDRSTSGKMVRMSEYVKLRVFKQNKNISETIRELRDIESICNMRNLQYNVKCGVTQGLRRQSAASLALAYIAILWYCITSLSFKHH